MNLYAPFSSSQRIKSTPTTKVNPKQTFINPQIRVPALQIPLPLSLSSNSSRSSSPLGGKKHKSNMDSPANYMGDEPTVTRGRTLSSGKYCHSQPHTSETHTMDTPTCMSTSPRTEKNTPIGTPTTYRTSTSMSVTAPATPHITLMSRATLSSSSSSTLSPSSVAPDAESMFMSPPLSSRGYTSRGEPEPQCAQDKKHRTFELSRTLYVSNVPRRIMGEDIHNLFKKSVGYVSSRMRRTKTDNYVAFVEFDTIQNALHAKACYARYSFDKKRIVNDGTGIFIEFSQKDSPQPTPAQCPPLFTQFHQTTGASDVSLSDQKYPENAFYDKISPDVSPITLPIPMQSLSPGCGELNNVFYGHCGHRHTQSEHRNMSAQEDEDEEFNRIMLMGKGSINETLYVEGIPTDATNREIAHIFRPYAGYKSLRLLVKKDNITGKDFCLCFVDFDTPRNAYVALTSLQGYKMDLSCTEQRGLTLYFSRTKKLF